MNKIFFFALFFTGCFASLSAEMQNHYILGTNGVKSAVIPEGFSFAAAYTYYTASTLKNEHGKDISLVGLDSKLTVKYEQNVFAYFSKYSFLDGLLGCRIDVPFISAGVDAIYINRSFALGSNSLGLSDIYFEPINLRWTFNKLYLFAAYGFLAPTGKFKPYSLKSKGLGNWGQLFTIASTYFLDQAQTFSCSFYANYEIHSKKRGIDFTPGNNFCMDWGIGKTFFKIATLGLVGYVEKQTTYNRGSAVPALDRKVKDEVAAIGPEIDLVIPPLNGQITFRYEVEFGAKARTQGRSLIGEAAFVF